MAKYKVLIWSEFPPKTKTGISIINKLIVDVFDKVGINYLIIEECAWNKGVLGTILHHFSNYFLVIFKLVHHKIKFLYFTFTLSRGGLLKVALVMPFFKLFSRRTKLVGHIHRGDFEDFSKNGLFNRLILKYYFFFLNKVVVLSGQIKDSVQAFSPRSEIIVLPNTSPVENVELLDQKAYHAKYICIANYLRTKGLEELVKSFSSAELKSAQLSIFGDKYNQSFMENLERIKSQNVNVCGPLERDQLLSEMKSHDALIVPSWNEGQPMVILEAMSLGMPVISTEVGDIPNMLGEKYPFLVEPKSEKALKETIVQFDNYKNKEKLSDSLYKRYIEKYSNAVFSENVTLLFKSKE